MAGCAREAACSDGEPLTILPSRRSPRRAPHRLPIGAAGLAFSYGCRLVLHEPEWRLDTPVTFPPGVITDAPRTSSRKRG